MTDRTEDFYCPHCRKYLFSAYTYTMPKAEREALNRQAATQCNCKSAAQEKERKALKKAETQQSQQGWKK